MVRNYTRHLYKAFNINIIYTFYPAKGCQQQHSEVPQQTRIGAALSY